jgi:uncharacterized OsmC-like protein
MNHITEISQNTKQLNGVEVDVLMGTIGAVQNDSETGACVFRATNMWLDGAKNQSTMSGFYATKQEIAHKHTLSMTADEPEFLGGADDEANPVEFLLHALLACMTTSMVAHSAVQGIEIRNIESTIEGELDLNGFFGIADIPRGFTKIRANFNIDADAADMSTIKSFIKFSPVLNTIVDGSNVEVSVNEVN